MNSQQYLELNETDCPAHPVCTLVGVVGSPCRACLPSVRSGSKLSPEMRRLMLVQSGVEQMQYCHQATILLLGKIYKHLGIEP